MTTIANCFNLDDATRLKMLLESAGIAVFIPDEVSAGVVPYHFINNTGVRVQVADEQAEEARRIIESSKDEPA